MSGIKFFKNETASQSMISPVRLAWKVFFFILVIKPFTIKARTCNAVYRVAVKAHRLEDCLISEKETYSELECAHLCLLENDQCTSINYEVQDPKSHNKKRKCQLNSATRSDKPNSMVADGTFNYLEVVTQEECNQHASCKGTRKTLTFNEKDTNDYAISNGSEAMEAITACLWVNTSYQSNDEITYISYASGKYYNAFELFGLTSLAIEVGSSDGDPKKSSSAGININDGQWHHICTTWKSDGGYYQFYKNGNMIYNGSDLSTNFTIPSGGSWVVGQDQDIVGGKFEVHQMMQGEVSEIHIWKKVLPPSEIMKISQSCQSPVPGDVKSWSDLTKDVRGNVTILQKCCKN